MQASLKQKSKKDLTSWTELFDGPKSLNHSEDLTFQGLNFKYSKNLDIN